jgi:hypothetical protein
MQEAIVETRKGLAVAAQATVSLNRSARRVYVISFAYAGLSLRFH